MKEKRSKEQGYSNTQHRVDELIQLLDDTWKQAERQPAYASWLIHEARGHNPLAEAIVLWGLDATESWEFVVRHHGLQKAQNFRRRLQESRAAFEEFKRR